MKIFYLANKISSIDNFLKKIKFPSSFSRTQRSLSFHNLFKANEYRNLAFYSLVYILKEALPEDYYENIIQYILFLRVLTKDKLSTQEINYSRHLIVKFIKEFKRLYGTINLKYKQVKVHFYCMVKISTEPSIVVIKFLINYI
jgi:hypothetical protein